MPCRPPTPPRTTVTDQHYTPLPHLGQGITQAVENDPALAKNDPALASQVVVADRLPRIGRRRGRLPLRRGHGVEGKHARAPRPPPAQHSAQVGLTHWLPQGLQVWLLEGRGGQG